MLLFLMTSQLRLVLSQHHVVLYLDCSGFCASNLLPDHGWYRKDTIHGVELVSALTGPCYVAGC